VNKFLPTCHSVFGNCFHSHPWVKLQYKYIA